MKIRPVLSLLFMAVFLAAGSASAETWHTYNTLLSHAVPNECYAGIGVDYPEPLNMPGAGSIAPGDGYTTPVQCPATIPNPNYDPDDPESPLELQVTPKTNDAYVWALTEEGDSLWFASAANVMCTTAGAFLGELSYGQTNIRVDRIDDVNVRVPCWVCEHGDSQVAREGIKMDSMGDWRPSKVFRYNKETGELTNLTDQIYAAGDGAVFDDLLGIRCAGSHNGVIFFAGGRQFLNGIRMFAFDDDGNYLGYQTYRTYLEIRKMIIVENSMYTGVFSAAGTGQVLRWNGSRTNPFSWQTVGRVAGSIAELSEYVDSYGRTRIVANAAGGLHVSPPMRWGRLFWWQAWGWQNVWSASDYETDPISARSYGPGALAQLGDWVYWGTMHIPYHAYYLNAESHFGGIENVPDDQAYNLYYGTHRATTIWRGRNLGQSGEEIQLVYGETHLGAWNNAAQTWVPAETGWTPLNMPPEGTMHPYFTTTPAGSSGFYNPYNNYSWTALSFSDATGEHLFFGTMDQTLIQTNDIRDLKPINYEFPESDARGSDLWRFSINSSIGGSDTTAVPEFTNGAGNIFQYGVRCLIASDDGEKIYIGMANNSSLIHPDSDLPGDEPRDWFKGGWELRELGR